MKKVISIQFDYDFAEKLEETAKKNYRSVGAQIRAMLEEYVKEHSTFEEKWTNLSSTGFTQTRISRNR